MPAVNGLTDAQKQRLLAASATALSNGEPLLVARVAESNPQAEFPPPQTNGSLCVVRSTRRLMYFFGSTWLFVAL